MICSLSAAAKDVLVDWEDAAIVYCNQKGQKIDGFVRLVGARLTRNNVASEVPGILSPHRANRPHAYTVCLVLMRKSGRHGSIVKSKDYRILWIKDGKLDAYGVTLKQLLECAPAVNEDLPGENSSPSMVAPSQNPDRR